MGTQSFFLFLFTNTFGMIPWYLLHQASLRATVCLQILIILQSVPIHQESVMNGSVETLEDNSVHIP